MPTPVNAEELGKEPVECSVLYITEDSSRDIEAIEGWLQEECADGEAKFFVMKTLAQIYLRIGSNTKVLSVAQEALKSNDPITVAQAHELRADAFCELQQWQNAKDELDQALELQSWWTLLAKRANAHERLGNSEQAKQDRSDAELMREAEKERAESQDWVVIVESATNPDTPGCASP